MALLFKSFGVAALGWLIGGAVAEEGSLRGIASNEKRAVELEGANMEQSLTAQNGQETDPEGPQSDLNETSQLQNLSQNLSQLQCSPKGCAVDVIQYQQQHPGAAYAAKAAQAGAAAALNTLQAVLDGAELLPLPGAVAFLWMGAALNVFFPQAGGLPTNPCTYATTDWGKCVWQEIKPFVQFFVQQQLNELLAFRSFLVELGLECSARREKSAKGGADLHTGECLGALMPRVGGPLKMTRVGTCRPDSQT
ncbi:hypothetical protein AK812_SmicGene387 [Symbiodinium microadriaticum]|uniref:Uncharacterized protein n=1 Tax=Symbiodinium microadriaticum TaxID=2951 RepID=A0A1Q9F6N9_SYMMI|nr:hypothetical protein AK812_SmicGene387 [Symbiodinium microadriaticum]